MEEEISLTIKINYMKKLGIYTLLLAMGSVTFMGCSSSKKSTKGGILGGDAGIGTTAVKTVATIIGVILLSKLLKSVLSSEEKEKEKIQKLAWVF